MSKDVRYKPSLGISKENWSRGHEAKRAVYLPACYVPIEKQSYRCVMLSKYRENWISRAEKPFVWLVFFSAFSLPHSAVAHRGKTQLNFSSETQQSFREHNNIFENTTIFLRTQQYF